MATLYLDLEAGNDANDGTSFANRKKTLAGASAIALPGDTVRIMASTTPNSLGVNGTFARGSTTITLASAVNAAIDTGETAWTASANVTTTTSTTRKQGSFSTSIALAAAFTTGLAAYKALGGATDFSAYQQLSLWFQQTSGTLGGFQIKLCSDAAGVTAVSTFTIPAPVVLNGWNRVTVNLGSAMGASIQSVAFYVTSDSGAQTYLLDNIVACKAPGTGELSHQTLIGKANSLGAGGNDSETWYAIRAIEGTAITLDLLNSSDAGSTTNGRFWGTSETVTAYSLFPSYVPTNVVAADLRWTAGGTDTQTLTISGGWNRTDMSTQTGQTWLAWSTTQASSVQLTMTSSYMHVSRLSLFGMSGSSTLSVHNSTLATISLSSCNGFVLNGFNNTASSLVLKDAGGASLNSDFSTIAFEFYSDQSVISHSTSVGSSITLGSNSVATGLTTSAFSKLTFNGTTYGSFGEASAAAVVCATALAESYRANGATGTLTQLLYEILAHLAEKSISGTTLTTKKLDHSTTAATHTLDSSTAPTSITRAT